MSIPNNDPMDMTAPVYGLIGTVSMRHAAVGSGLGLFGRHNLVIHPQLGTQVFYTGVLTNLAIEPDLPLDPMESLCADCDICVENCPALALEKENYTDVTKCIRVCQPYGLANAMFFGKKILQANLEERIKMITSAEFMQYYHVLNLGMHYECFNCYSLCPACKE